MYVHLLLSISSFLLINYLGGYFKTKEMAPKYKLIYFDAPGRAEHIRYIFHYAGVEFEDFRISKDKWPTMKNDTPFGKLPVLEIDGKPVAQSMAIGRHLARKHNLAGKNEWEELQCDVLIDSLSDVKQSIMEPMREKDPIKKEEIKARVAKEVVPFYMSKFEKIVSENNGFAVGASITWADFMFAISLETFESMYGKGALDQYPALKSLKDKVNALPGIKEWLAVRPPPPARP